MSDLKKLFEKNTYKKVALYGLGTETERFLSEYGNRLFIVGLLDGFRTDGEIYNYPIIPVEDTPQKGVKLIIVVARPGSCKAIVKRIGDFCREKNIALFDVRGRDLLAVGAVSFDFKNVDGVSRQDFIKKVEESDIISFDLFDTLVMRKTMSYTDVFELLDYQLRESGIYIPDFAKLRLYAEKELSRDGSPELEKIYDFVLERSGGNFITASELAELEWKLDFSIFSARDAVRDIYKKALSGGKKVVITTDSYYSKKQIEKILNTFGLVGYDELLVSCEYGTAKTQGLFNILSGKYRGKKILHIGDDEYSDIEKARCNGIESVRIFRAIDLFDALGGLGIENEIVSVADRVKMGLFLAHIFNSPFWFDGDERRLFVKDAFDIGYLFCAPMVTDFILWMKESVKRQGYTQILFGARDGFLVGQLFRMVDTTRNSYYFLSSRTAAIRAGMETQEDIDYVDSMKYSGILKDALKVRFGIMAEDVGSVDRNIAIFNKAKQQRENYQKYIDKLGIGSNKLAVFDLVSKGTVQMYLQRLFPQHMKGFYFLRLEPEFMADKGLDIESFYSNEETLASAVYDNYYILETILTAPYPQIKEMDNEGNPIFAVETRSEQDLRCFKRAQNGIKEYFKEYISILPESARKENKKLDEKLLAFVNKVQILDEDFLALKVEDLFFGRMTDIKDIIG